MNIKEFKELLALSPDDLDVSELFRKAEIIKGSEKQLEVITSEMATDKPTEEFICRVKHLANLGDIIASLASCKRYHEATGRRIQYAQVVNHEAAYYQGAIHPTIDETTGKNVCVNNTGFDMIKPLIEAQPYIHSFVKYEGQPIDLNFDVIRGQTDVNMPHGMLAAWIVYAFPDLATDLSKPWVTLPGECPEHISQQVKGKVIINFTERYRSHAPLDYYFLRNYAPDLIFSGTEREAFLFCNKWGLQIPRIEVKDFLDLAYALKECRFMMGTQSFHWNISNAMGSPRVLEVCKWADNCQPFVGEDNVGHFYQVGIEYYFRTMYNKTVGK
jgi:hypothetical protein